MIDSGKTEFSMPEAEFESNYIIIKSLEIIMNSNPQLAKSKSMKLAYKEMMKGNKYALFLGKRVLVNENHLQIWGTAIFKKELIHAILQNQIPGWKPNPTK